MNKFDSEQKLIIIVLSFAFFVLLSLITTVTYCNLKRQERLLEAVKYEADTRRSYGGVALRISEHWSGK